MLPSEIPNQSSVPFLHIPFIILDTLISSVLSAIPFLSFIHIPPTLPDYSHVIPKEFDIRSFFTSFSRRDYLD
jgi:hypothetical protein